MRRVFSLIAFGIFWLFIGVVVGICFGPKMKTVLSEKVPMIRSLESKDKNSPIESEDYPTIKFRAKPLDDKGAIVQLSTRFEGDKGDPAAQSASGKVNYKLTIFKAPDKSQCEVQLLDVDGFKLLQFDASDFHQLPGTADIMESRDSYACSEDLYRRVRDYSIK